MFVSPKWYGTLLQILQHFKAHALPSALARACATWPTPTQHFSLRRPEKPVVSYLEYVVPVHELSWLWLAYLLFRTTPNKKLHGIASGFQGENFFPRCPIHRPVKWSSNHVRTEYAKVVGFHLAWSAVLCNFPTNKQGNKEVPSI